MKKFIIKGFIGFLILYGVYIFISPIYFRSHGEGYKTVVEDNVDYWIRNEDGSIQIYDQDGWKEFSIRGITLTEKVPGVNEYEATADKKTMLNWLKQIDEMNINTIKVPEIQGTTFYDAIFEHNKNADNPIFLIHEIPLDEIYMYNSYDVFNNDLIKELKKDIKDTINIVHGRKVSIFGRDNIFQVYNKDISRYVLGYTIGNQWKNSFVKLSVEANKEKTSFKGEYIEGDQLNGLETFLAEMMDYTLSYEMDKFGEQRMISFINTMEFDPIIHNQQDSIYRNTSLDIDKLKGTEILKTPIIGSYIISSEYTDFLNYASVEDGQFNSVLEEYLKALHDYHSTPILISSIGYSTARAISFEPNNNQPGNGGIDEKQQGEILISDLDSIYSENFIGAVLNSWQDTWGKNNTWNTKHITMANIDGEWLDVQSTNQSTGILSFIPEKDGTSYMVDGLKDEWKKEDIISQVNGLKLYSKYDMNYLYILIESEDLKVLKDRFYIGIDITPNSGSEVATGIEDSEEIKLNFDKPVDFIAAIRGVNDSEIKVQSRYDIFSYYYKYYTNILDKISRVPEKENEEFQSIFLLTMPQYFNEENSTIEPPKYYDTGNLIYGNAKPGTKDYNSIADFYSGENLIELRIPWLMLNMVNPVDGKILDDFYSKGLKEYKTIDHLNLQLIGKAEDGECVKLHSGKLKISGSGSVKYEERLKESYWILKEYFKGLKEEQNNGY